MGLARDCASASPRLCVCAEESDQSLLKILHSFVLSLQPLWRATMTAFLPGSQPNERKNHCDAQDFFFRERKKNASISKPPFCVEAAASSKEAARAHFAVFWTFPRFFPPASDFYFARIMTILFFFLTCAYVSD